ncbi:hypothetical protein PGB90_007648 [Kerria lacca]
MSDKTKRKRIKVECMCGSKFDIDYRNKHEASKHERKGMNIKFLNAPDNPFKVAKRSKKADTVNYVITGSSRTQI